MEFITLSFITLGLAMDAFAVSITNGICYKEAGVREAVVTATTFGVFQAIMPLLGYYAGMTVKEIIESIDHWVALILLVFIGVTMIVGAIKDMQNPQNIECKLYCTKKDLFIQGIATSIDAFVVGISLAVIDTNIFLAVALIGIVTFSFCLLGIPIGKRFGSLLRDKAEIIGGCILIIIGLKIFIESMV